MRIAIGGIHTECASANPSMQYRSDFDFISGTRLMASLPQFENVDYVPLFHARSLPGGPVAYTDYQAIKDKFLRALTQAGKIDGICLLMHGAMLVEGLDDPEGDWIDTVRAAYPDTPISASFDPHGNVTSRVTEALDAFAAYRTAPHIDVTETHGRAISMLVKMITTGVRPKVYRQTVPLLVSGEMSSTVFSPMREFCAGLTAYDDCPDIWDANMMVGYVWADEPRAIATAIVTASHEKAGLAACREIAGSYWALRDKLQFAVPTSTVETAFDDLDCPIILCDSGDNPTAGGVGDRADLIAMAITAQRAGQDFPPMLFAGIWMPYGGAIFGGQAGGGGPTVTIQPDSEYNVGECTIMREGAMTIIAHKKRKSFHKYADFTALGINVADYTALVIKIGYLVPELAALGRDTRLILSHGAVSQDLASLPNKHRNIRALPF